MLYQSLSLYTSCPSNSEFKIFEIQFWALHGQDPAYFKELLQPHVHLLVCQQNHTTTTQWITKKTWMEDQSRPRRVALHKGTDAGIFLTGFNIVFLHVCSFLRGWWMDLGVKNQFIFLGPVALNPLLVWVTHLFPSLKESWLITFIYSVKPIKNANVIQQVQAAISVYNLSICDRCLTIALHQRQRQSCSLSTLPHVLSHTAHLALTGRLPSNHWWGMAICSLKTRRI